MRGRDRNDPAWKRFYDVCGRASLLLQERRITVNCYEIIYEQSH